MHSPLRFYKLVLTLLIFYSLPGWSSCNQCRWDPDGFPICNNFHCQNFLPESNEEEQVYEKYLLEKQQRKEEAARERQQLTQKTKKPPQAAAAMQAGTEFPLVNELIQRMVNQHENFWGVMIKAAVNNWQNEVKAVNRELVVQMIKLQAMAYRNTIPDYKPPPFPDIRTPQLMLHAYPPEGLAFTPKQLHTSLTNLGYSLMSFSINSTNNLVRLLTELFEQQPATLAVLTYTYLREEEGEDELNYVFMLNDEARVLCFSDAQNLYRKITILPGLFELIYTTVYGFNPNKGDTLTLTLYIPAIPNGTDLSFNTLK